MAPLLLAALGWAPVAGCSDESAKQEQKRELLAPLDERQVIEDRRRERELFDEKGDLLPSDQRVGGVLLPKGLELEQQLDRQWLYGTQVVPTDKVVEYFSRRLMSTTVDRRSNAVIFGGAVPTDDLKAPRLSVEVTTLQNSATRVFIEQTTPFEPKIPPHMVEEHLRVARERAD